MCIGISDPTAVVETTHGDAARHAPAADTPRYGGHRLQITMSPYYGRPDFSHLANVRYRLDAVSVADLLRNGFVHPPHSVYEDVKLVTFGFSPLQDMYRDAEYHFQFPASGMGQESKGQKSWAHRDWAGTYHRLLCRAVSTSCREVRSPWLLQSGGKDSTSLAIAAAAVRPDTTCITYLGGREENEVASASFVARKLGLRHETLVCDPARAYDRYLAIVPDMPLLTADFALLSYVDLATSIRNSGGDGVIDGVGSDWYFGMLMSRKQRTLEVLSQGLCLPVSLSELPLVDRSFRLCFALSTLEMTRVERLFPGSRFSDAEVDQLLGREVSRLSRSRLATFQSELDAVQSPDERWCMISSLVGDGAFAKGLYTLCAMSLRAVYPFCDQQLREWVYREVPQELRMDPVANCNKILMRQHIATKFSNLPYVAKKGCFRFDVRGLAKARFDQVHSYAMEARDLLPGAAGWLERNRRRLDNKYHASKFYLLAVVLPWIASRGNDARMDS